MLPRPLISEASMCNTSPPLRSTQGPLQADFTLLLKSVRANVLVRALLYKIAGNILLVLRRRFSRHIRRASLRSTDAISRSRFSPPGLARVELGDRVQAVFGEVDVLLFSRCFKLLGSSGAWQSGSSRARCSREPNDLQPILQGRRNRVKYVRRRDEHDIRQSYRRPGNDRGTRSLLGSSTSSRAPTDLPGSPSRAFTSSSMISGLTVRPFII